MPKINGSPALSHRGRSRIKDGVCEREHQVGQEILSGFTPEEQTQLVQFLSRMRDNLLRSTAACRNATSAAIMATPGMQAPAILTTRSRANPTLKDTLT
jgi:hypothetical protein